MKKCKMTVSGKHMWRDVEDGVKDTIDVGFTVIFKYYNIKKCVACGLVDDRKKKNENNN